MTFGATQGGKQVCEYVRVGLQLRNGQGQIVTLFSVPEICEPLASHPIVDCRRVYPHLRGLEFADESDDVQKLHVDILIGSDYYWDLITGQVQRGDKWACGNRHEAWVGPLWSHLNSRSDGDVTRSHDTLSTCQFPVF